MKNARAASTIPGGGEGRGQRERERETNSSSVTQKRKVFGIEILTMFCTIDIITNTNIAHHLNAQCGPIGKCSVKVVAHMPATDGEPWNI